MSRRVLLAAGLGYALTARAAGRGTRFESPPSEIVDALTGRVLERLTDPAVLHHLPAPYQRFISRKDDFLLLAGEVSGERQIHQYDLKRGRMTQLTEGPDIHPYAATMTADERAFFYLQGDALYEGSTRGRGPREIYRSDDGWRLTGELSVTTNSQYAAVVEMEAGHETETPDELFRGRPKCRIRIVSIGGASPARTAVEEQGWLAAPQFRPGGLDLLYAREGPWAEVDGRLQLISAAGQEAKSLRPREGDEQVGQAFWSADGSRIEYVFYPGAGLRNSTIRAIDPDSGEESVISPCSGYGWMQTNLDSSVIVGASRRPSGPNLYILFASLQREITLGEHAVSGKAYPIAGSDRTDPHASEPNPVFSPDSQWVYFTTDREGMPAVYRMRVDDLVSET